MATATISISVDADAARASREHPLKSSGTPVFLLSLRLRELTVGPNALRVDQNE